MSDPPRRNTALPQQSLLRPDVVQEYRRHRNTVGRQMYRSVLRAHATIEAAQMCNDRFEREGLLDVRVDLNELVPMIEMLARLEMLSMLAREARIPLQTKQAIVDRLLARLAPAPGGSDGVVSRRPNLEAAMRREMEKMSGGKPR